MQHEITYLKQQLESEKRRSHQKDLDYEELRQSSTQTITDLQSKVYELTTTKLSAESTILAHQNTIKHMEDVHD